MYVFDAGQFFDRTIAVGCCHRWEMNRRQILQLIIFIVVISAGVRFYMYVSALENGMPAGVKPGAVEGFLPISALMSFKRLILTGVYDTIHPAGLTLFIFILGVSIIFKKSFCSHICPVGFISELMSGLGKKVRIHKFIFHPLTVIKYGVLGFFAYIILYSLPVSSIESFIHAPYNIVADAKMLKFFLAPSKTTIIVLAVILFLTLVFKNIWCRVMCPYGALLGLISVVSPFKVKRDEKRLHRLQKVHSRMSQRYSGSHKKAYRFS